MPVSRLARHASKRGFKNEGRVGGSSAAARGGTSRGPGHGREYDQAMSGFEIADSETRVVLYEEQSVVGKRTVRKWRVRLEKDAASGEETVQEVRKERIERRIASTGELAAFRGIRGVPVTRVVRVSAEEGDRWQGWQAACRR
jgi:hypothetical protein